MDRLGLIHYSLGLAFEHLEHLVSELTQEQADWMPPGKANPIGALYWHIAAYCDQVVHDWCMPPFLQITIEEWWAARLGGQELVMGQPPLRHSAERGLNCAEIIGHIVDAGNGKCSARVARRDNLTTFIK